MKKYRRPVQIVILLFIVILGGYAISSAVLGSHDRLETGDKAPSFSLLGIDGRVHQLKEYEGKAMVINFWGSWCKPCVKEMPALQHQWEKWKDKGVVVVGINAGEDQMTVQNFAEGRGVTFPVLLDPDSEAQRDYNISPLPTTFFVSAKGEITSIHQGELDLDTLDSQISQLVKP
ncbi:MULTISPECIES: thiol-disulfide oxidoreductase ResA [Paenibacillus]|uniref:thiol-disulfide oxidoreductase ResA n=1 Tax=Paenibacillus TaxID=44249 RepID=UPI0008383CAB|nr:MULTISPECIES: thiol-disulfide oxidoreductase ResA [Paenibacillus]GIP20148.1 thiol-disulfide oxidoreductase ResA [Paenibacillus sp. J22TS3]